MYVLIPLKDRIVNLEGENNNCYILIQEEGKRAEKAIKDMEEHNLHFSPGTVDNTKWPLLKSNFDYAHNKNTQLIEEYKNTSDEIIRLTDELAEKCLNIAQEAEDLEIPSIKAIRKELSFPFDERAYREMIEMSNIEWEENLQKFIASKKDLYKEIKDKYGDLKEPPQQKIERKEI